MGDICDGVLGIQLLHVSVLTCTWEFIPIGRLGCCWCCVGRNIPISPTNKYLLLITTHAILIINNSKL